MLHYVKGNILNSLCKALINPVNCQGVMGAGLAKEFKLAYPEMYENYKVECENKTLGPGGFYCFQDETGKLIICLATKNKWKEPSKMAWIEQGLATLGWWITYQRIHSIAIPAIGCGLGGLDWDEVKQKIEETHEKHWKSILVEVYVPEGHEIK